MEFLIAVSFFYVIGYFFLSYFVPAMTGYYFDPKWYLVWPFAFLGAFFLMIIIMTSTLVFFGSNYLYVKGIEYYERNN